MTVEDFEFWRVEVIQDYMRQSLLSLHRWGLMWFDRCVNDLHIYESYLEYDCYYLLVEREQGEKNVEKVQLDPLLLSMKRMNGKEMWLMTMITLMLTRVCRVC